MCREAGEERLPEEPSARSGEEWRVGACPSQGKLIDLEGQDGFDELVIGEWLHIEWMGADCWWLRVGDTRIMVHLHGREQPDLQVVRGFYLPRKGETLYLDDKCQVVVYREELGVREPDIREKGGHL